MSQYGLFNVDISYMLWWAGLTLTTLSRLNFSQSGAAQEPGPGRVPACLCYISCLQIAGPGAFQTTFFSQIWVGVGGGGEEVTQPVIVWCLYSKYQFTCNLYVIKTKKLHISTRSRETRWSRQTDFDKNNSPHNGILQLSFGLLIIFSQVYGLIKHLQYKGGARTFVLFPWAGSAGSNSWILLTGILIFRARSVHASTYYSEVREQKDGSVLVLAEEEDDSDKEGLPHRTFARQGGLD